MEKVVLRVADGTEMQCHVTRPAKSASGKTPGLIMFQEAFGVNSHMDVVAQQFADQGFLVIAPELFHRTTPAGFIAAYDQFPQIIEHYKAVNEKTVAQDAQACFDWLIKENGVKQVASIGYCMGGKASYLANAAVKLNAAISYYGGGISDFLALAPKLNSDMLFFWGGLDKNIPAEQVMKINEALSKAEKRYSCVQISDAHHAFSNEERESYNANASNLAFATSMEFLRQRLEF